MADILIKGVKMPKKGQYLQILIAENGEMSYEHVYYDSPRVGFILHKSKAVALQEHELISVHKVLDYLAERAETSKEMGDDETASLFASMGGDILAMSVEANNGTDN